MLAPKNSIPSDNLLQLISDSDDQKVRLTIYVPIKRLENTSAILLKLSHALREAKELLQTATISAVELDVMIKRIKREFKRQLDCYPLRGIAIFSTVDEVQAYAMFHEPPELVVAADSYHIKPLLQEMHVPRNWYVLDTVGTQFKCYTFRDGSVQKIFEHSLKLDVSPSRTGFVGQKRRGKEQREVAIRRCLEELMQQENFDQAYVAIRGPGYLRSRIMLELGLNAKTREMIQLPNAGKLPDIFLQLYQRAEYNELKENNISASKNIYLERSQFPGITELAQAAHQGRIRHLYIDPNIRIWGKTDPIHGVLNLSEYQQDHRDDCIFDDIIQEVIKFDGQVSFIKPKQVNGEKPYFVEYRW